MNNAIPAGIENPNGLGQQQEQKTTSKSIHVSQIKGRVHVAIITIRADEYETMEHHLENPVRVVGGNNNYKYATIKSDNQDTISVILTRCSAQGNLKAQAVANNIIQDVDPSWLFLVGIAGGVPSSEYSLGDVILASFLHDFSLTAALEDERGLSQTGGGGMHPDVDKFISGDVVGVSKEKLRELAGFTSTPAFLKHPPVLPADHVESNAFYGSAESQENTKRSVVRRFPNWTREGGPTVYAGPCANGNVLVKDTKLLEIWQKSARQIVEVETELAGVYMAAHSAGRQNYPVLAVRGLSDIVGLKRDPAWTQYACETAAAFTHAILRSGFIDFAKNLPAPLASPYTMVATPKIQSPIVPKVDITKLQLTDGVFLNRDKEMKLLDAAWADTGRTHIVVLDASSGVGKTSLVKRWLLEKLKMDNWRGAEFVYGWTFRKLGTLRNPQASEDGFFTNAMSWFGVANVGKSPLERGEILAETLRQHRALLILDGIEVLQNPPGREGGKLRTLGLQSLLMHLASAGHPGLCVVTSQQAVKDLDEFRRSNDHPTASVIVCDLDHLDKKDGARLLYELGVKRAGKVQIGKADRELEQASDEVRGHAFTLQLLGNYLARGYEGDIRHRHLVKFVNDDESNAFKMLAAWEKWLISGGEDTAPQLAVLRLLSLFSGPADANCLTALRRAPVIPGLTESLVRMNDTEWNIILSYLNDCKLVQITRDESGMPNYKGPVDCHLLNREYFAKTLLKQNPKSIKAAHQRLYEYLTKTPDKPHPTFSDLLPLYEAVTHGCNAGCAQKVYDEIYIRRINRCTTGPDAYYACRTLGAYNGDFVALNCFFQTPWDDFLPGINDQTKLEILSHAASLLHGLGRVDEALKPLESALRLLSGQSKKNRKTMASFAVDIAVQAWRAGDIKKAVIRSKEATKFSDKSKDKAMRVKSLICHAYALFLAGKSNSALSILKQADKIQASASQPYDWWQNFRIFELLLADAEKVSWLRFLGANIEKPKLEASKNAILEAKQRIAPIVRLTQEPKLGVVDRGLYNLILGRIALYTAQCFNGSDAQAEKASANKYLKAAVDNLGSIGMGARPLCLVSRAWLRQLDGNDENDARLDLDEAWRIATRGSMLTHTTDIYLYRARLFFRAKSYPWQNPKADLDKTRQLIKDCGYGRRKEELEDAEKLIRSLRHKSL